MLCHAYIRAIHSCSYVGVSERILYTQTTVVTTFTAADIAQTFLFIFSFSRRRWQKQSLNLVLITLNIDGSAPFCQPHLVQKRDRNGKKIIQCENEKNECVGGATRGENDHHHIVSDITRINYYPACWAQNKRVEDEERHGHENKHSTHTL